MAAGDITYSNPAGMSGEGAFASGIVLADADTAINVIVGFIPSQIVLFYKDTGETTVDKVLQWFKGMTAGTYWSTLMSTGVITEATSGPVVYGDTTDDTYTEGSAPSYEQDKTGHGFTIPAGLMDADSDKIYWQAWR